MPARFIRYLLLWCLTCLLAFQSLATTHTQFNQRPDVQRFINMMVTKYHFDRKYLNELFAQVKPQPQIITGMSRTAETLPWYKYENIFITQQRINQGVDFWNHHAETLAKVQDKDGVPASIIVAIIGVETYYGQNQGNYRVIDSLATLAFDYPKRASFFQSELKDYLLLVRENHFDARSILGSYAGAIGQAQFMPSSYRNYAIDYRNNGRKDLRRDADDVIASVSNYFKQFGWQRNQAIVLTATVKGKNYQQLPMNQLKPNRSIIDLKKAGVFTTTSIPNQTPASFICLATSPNQYGYWLGMHNFYVLSRYNPRINYAMAVFTLSQALEAKRGQITKMHPTPLRHH